MAPGRADRDIGTLFDGVSAWLSEAAYELRRPIRDGSSEFEVYRSGPRLSRLLSRPAIELRHAGLLARLEHHPARSDLATVRIGAGEHSGRFTSTEVV